MQTMAGSHEIDDYGALIAASAGSHDTSSIDQIRKLFASKNPLREMLENRPSKVNSAAFVAEIKVKTDFRESDEGLQLSKKMIDGVMTLRRKIAGGGEETYSQKLDREERKGAKEAASFGVGNIDGQEFMFYTMKWEFFAGSMGIVAGEKFKRAAREAAKRKIPLVGIFSSSGVRQHENFAGLMEMSRMNYEIDLFKKRTGLPYVSVLVGDVWGGISASAVPQGDLKVAIEGTSFGFTGPKVIEGFTGENVPRGAQSVEAHLINRNVDLVLKDADQTLRFLKEMSLLVVSEEKRRGSKKIQQVSMEQLRPIHHLTQPERFQFAKGFSTFLDSKAEAGDIPERDLIFQRKDVGEESLYERVSTLLKDGNRPDTEFLLRSCFDRVVPLYSRYVSEDGSIRYPAIIAGIGKIGDQAFLVIGDQPSYQFQYGLARKQAALPSPADFRYLKNMLSLGERYSLPVVFFTDTPGARPTLDAEVVGQSQEISDAISRTNTYRYPVISIVTGMLGSGGGLATTPLMDHIAMTSRSMAFVASPDAAASILYGEANPDMDKVSFTIDTIGATAQRQLELGLIDGIIEEPHGGSENNPWEIAEGIRNHIAVAFSDVAGLSRKKLQERRDTRMTTHHKIPFE